MGKEAAEKTRDPVVKRLDVIINLMLQAIEAQSGNEEEQRKRKEIKMLNDAGLSNAEVAQILGKSEGYIGSALSKLKKATKKQKSR